MIRWLTKCIVRKIFTGGFFKVRKMDEMKPNQRNAYIANAKAVQRNEAYRNELESAYNYYYEHLIKNANSIEDVMLCRGAILGLQTIDEAMVAVSNAPKSEQVGEGQ